MLPLSLYDRGVMMLWRRVLCLCMDTQRVSFGSFSGSEPLIACYASVSKTATQLISLNSVFLSLSAK